MDTTPPVGSPGDFFFKTPLGAGLIALVIGLSGSWFKDRLSMEQRDNGSVVRIENLEKRVDNLQGGALTKAQFDEFRTAQDRTLEGIKQDIRDLIAEVNSEKSRR